MANRVSQWFRKLSGHHAHHHHRKMTREDFQKLPRHVAIIMDGNGRWAKQHRLNVAWGIGRERKPCAKSSAIPTT